MYRDICRELARIPVVVHQAFFQSKREGARGPLFFLIGSDSTSTVTTER